MKDSIKLKKLEITIIIRDKINSKEREHWELCKTGQGKIFQEDNTDE